MTTGMAFKHSVNIPPKINFINTLSNHAISGKKYENRLMFGNF